MGHTTEEILVIKIKPIKICILFILLILSCNRYKDEKDWVHNFIQNTTAVVDSLIENDSSFVNSMKNDEIDEMIKYFQTYRSNYQIQSVNYIYDYDNLHGRGNDQVYLGIRVDARNDKHKCTFNFIKNSNDLWSFSFIHFEDY